MNAGLWGDGSGVNARRFQPSLRERITVAALTGGGGRG
jgi:hypothetical protein